MIGLWERIPRISRLAAFQFLSVFGIVILLAAFIAYNLGIGDIRPWELLGLAIPAMIWTGVAIYLQNREWAEEESEATAGDGEEVLHG